jgi:hypothetical protein
VLAAVRKAGLKRIDYLLVTHYHNDHYGAVAEVLEKFPVSTVLDHGPSVETGKNAAWKERWQLGTNDAQYAGYVKARAKVRHTVLKVGDRIPVAGIDVRVVNAGGKTLDSRLSGAGKENPACGQTGLRSEDETEDGQSVGIVIAYGSFRFAHLGDLTWNRSYRMFCPRDPIGQVDVYLSTHHGMSIERATSEVRWGRSCCPEPEVHALRPRVAVLNCGERYHRLGTPRAWQVIRNSPGLEGFWQLHYQAEGGRENNAAEDYIANLSARNCQGHSIKLSAEADGRFTVTNERNGFTRTYTPRE